jgi:hypothetical protein
MSSPLLSLAILRVNQRKFGNDYLDSFLPLIARLLPGDTEKPIEVDGVISSFLDNYGLVIPYHAMVSILNRARKKGLVYKKCDRLYPSIDSTSGYDITTVVAEKQVQYQNLLEELIQFGSERFAITMSQSDAENALLGFIKDHELDILFAAEQASFFKADGSTRQNKHIVYRFIQEAHQTHAEAFKFILDLVLGHAFASTILYGQGDVFNSSVRKLNIFLDTRFVLQLRGLEGEDRKRHAEELVSLLKQDQVHLFLFDHTFREITNIVNSCPDGLRRLDYDPSRASKVLRYMKEHNYTSDDAERIALGMTDFLKQYEIEVVDHPDPDKFREYQISEEQLFSKLDIAYMPNRPEIEDKDRTRTIQADVDSIAAIYRLRKGDRGRYLKNVKYVFVSTNHVFSAVAREFDIELNGAEFRIPPVVTDFFIGTTIWIHSPIIAERAIEYRLLAECYADVLLSVRTGLQWIYLLIRP